MLIQMSIKNLATIEELNLEMQSGTSVITGETGAGKSILIDAIELGLGGRGTADLIREGSEKADISLHFDVSKIPFAESWLKNYELNTEKGECIIRRTITKEGRSRSYINGMPTTLQPLQEISELLVSIHGQHENQGLLKSNIQRDILDRYASHTHLLDRVKLLSEEHQQLVQKINNLQKLSSERRQRSELLKFQLLELDELNIQPNEFQLLDLEHKELAHADELLKQLSTTLNSLSQEEDQNALDMLNKALQSLETLNHLNPKVANWTESLKQGILLISDTEEEIRRYFEHVELDPKRLYEVEKRLSKLFDVARKYRVEPQELFDFHRKLQHEFLELESCDGRLASLTKQISELEINYHEAAQKLSKSRLKNAKKLADDITLLIRELALPHGEFHIHLEPETTFFFSPMGVEKVVFLIRTNIGQPLQLLAKVASGGELSRISLAIHLATAEQNTISTLIFDEVDVGIGGGTAEIVGKLLRRLGKTHQVICITHAPQVAAQGHHHLLVAKNIENNATFTRVQPLTVAEKVKELARMLGGVEITPTTLEHAQEMIGNVNLGSL